MASAFGIGVRRAIGHSLGRFLAIAVMAALGCGFYAGLQNTAPDMKLAADTYYDQTNLYDVRVVSTLGITDVAAEAVRGVEGVQAAMPAHQVDALAQIEGAQYAVRAHSLEVGAAQLSGNGPGEVEALGNASYINRPLLVRGSWPTAANECVLSADAVNESAIVLGSTVVVSQDAGGVADALAGFEYTVVGFVRSSYYPSSTNLGATQLGAGSLDQYMYVPAEAFAEGAPYAELLVSVQGASEELSGSAAYDARVNDVLERIKALGPDLCAQRLEEVRAAAQAEVDAGRAQLDAERADAYAQLDAADAELAGVKAQLDAARNQLDWAASAIAQNEKALADARDAAASFGSGAGASLGADATEEERERAQQKQVEAQQKRAAAQAQMAASESQISAGRAGYASNLAQYEEGMRAYDAKAAEAAAARADADARFAQAEADLAAAQAEVDALQEPEWIVLDRSKNAGIAGLQADANRIASIASVFPFIFFLVAALVSLTTMTRMVEEERVLVGTYKALGYGNARIASKYLIYGAVASAVGGLVGIVALSKFLPWFIMEAYSIVYAVPVRPTPVDPLIALFSLGLGVGITVGATWLAVYASLRESPAALMLPRAPKAGKRIVLERSEMIWHNLSFSWKVTARNLFRYKRRFFMATVGIAGCTALLLTGLGLQNAINDIIDKQFGGVCNYNATVRLANDVSAEDQAAVESALEADGRASAYMQVHTGTFIAQLPDGSLQRPEVVVPRNPQELPNFVTMRTRVGQEGIQFNSAGAVITEKLARQLGVSVGDTFTLFDQDSMGNATGEGYEFTVGGIMENYVGQYVYLTPAVYRQATGTEPAYRTIFAKVTEDEAAREALSSELLGIGGVKTAGFNDETIETYRTMLKSVDSVVVVLVVAAALLAFVVLYNLTNINITERIREIATLKVLGFTPREVNSYIFRETMILAAFGALVGLVLGVFMEGFVVATAEVDQVMFGRDIHAASFGMAFALTMLFAAVVATFMRHKLAKVDMVESLKSVE